MKARLRNLKGFTLVEILVTIAILAILAAAAWQAYGMIENSKRNKKADLDISLLQKGMEDYYTDRMEYPWGKGDEYSSHVLYVCLSGDYDNNGRPDYDNSGNALQVYCPQLVAVDEESKTVQEGIACEKLSIRGKDLYTVSDPWSGCYRYRLGADEKANPEAKLKPAGKSNNRPGKRGSSGKTGPGVNGNFDIYTLGPDGEGDCRTKTGDGNDDNRSNIPW